MISRTTYSGGDLATSEGLHPRGGRHPRQAVVRSRWPLPPGNRRAITNPIWVNGPDVPATQTITEVNPSSATQRCRPWQRHRATANSDHDQPPMVRFPLRRLAADGQQLRLHGEEEHQLHLHAHLRPSPSRFVFDSTLKDSQGGGGCVEQRRSAQAHSTRSPPKNTTQIGMISWLGCEILKHPPSAWQVGKPAWVADEGARLQLASLRRRVDPHPRPVFTPKGGCSGSMQRRRTWGRDESASQEAHRHRKAG